MISKLISCKTKTPNDLKEKIEYIKLRWSQTVTNKVAPGCQVKYYLYYLYYLYYMISNKLNI